MLQQLKRDVPLHFARAPGNAELEPNRKEAAAVGEQIALDWFMSRGLVLVERNWRSGRFTEIDLILRRRDSILVFVEVKTRRIWRDNAGFVDYGFDAINWSKRRKILIGARAFIAKRKLTPRGYQCDAVLVTYDRIAATKDELLVYNPQILHIEGAFDSV